MQAAKGLAQQESSLESSASNLNKIQLIQRQMGYQYAAIRDGSEILADLKEQVSSMER
jgi:hypothetical protein